MALFSDRIMRSLSQQNCLYVNSSLDKDKRMKLESVPNKGSNLRNLCFNYSFSFLSSKACGDRLQLVNSSKIGSVDLKHCRPSYRSLVVKSRRYKDRDREREALPYVVTVITPPPRPLGVHHLPPNMQCGETVEVKGEPFIVSSVTYRYQLRRGRYEPSQKRLEVQTTGRYLVNLFLDNLLDTS